MEKEYNFNLKDFVELCNKCKYDKYVSKEGRDSFAKNLADDFLALMKDENAIVNDKEDKDFYDYLKEKNVKDRYVFCQDSSQDSGIVAEVNVFEPYVKDETGNNILNQKWHVLISWLALLEFRNYKEYDKSYIEKVEVRENSGSVIFSNGTKTPYHSIGMHDWILHVIGEIE